MRRPRTFGVIGGKKGGPVVRFFVTLGLLCDSPHRTGWKARRACTCATPRCSSQQRA